MALVFGKGEYVFTGIANVLFDDKVTGETVCACPIGTDLTYSDDLTVNYVRGGLNNKRQIMLTADRDTKITFNVATITDELLALKTNTELKSESTDVKMFEELATGDDGKVTLSNTPKTDTYITVKPVNTNGVEGKALTVGDPSTTEDNYSISGNEITVNSAVKKVNVYYTTTKTMQSMELKDISSKNYVVNALLVGKSKGGQIISGVLRAGNASVTPSFSFSAKNSSDVPDAMTIEIDCLDDAFTGYPIKIMTDIVG